ncbi:MAG: hypothetical protein MUE33_11780 [Cytophagaceae bacterium]|jgi:hypothetical protein|nr:hypothetical protein [Cytophagaceae bacterium]
MSVTHENYKKLFWDGFHRPHFKSTRIQLIWESLDKLNDVLAGPLFAVYEKGHCLYILEDKSRFPNIHTWEDVRRWAIYFTDAYSDEINSIEDLTEDEKYDVQVLRFQNDTRVTLIDLAITLSQQSTL